MDFVALLHDSQEWLVPVRFEAEHREALAEIDRLWKSCEGSLEEIRLETLAAAVDVYENKLHPW